ncbi:DUF2867 domain-containing protein [Nocardioides mesophilus]|uniref:DUF2867 domain-containing protein n=1 Tax=Nocardioides mesophilus TaxID=433659 RepID=A0A7G9R9J7_9ACTN|nr:DUF2867 domain-containing protein [Nocardioides mesophilus]QNN52272.1 DUF2867 domain-containing protein [Nocardioides mesophilus]
MAYVDEHVQNLSVPVEAAWSVVLATGGDPSRYVPRGLWRLRGVADRAVGGPGFRLTGPGRRPAPGDAIDFWEVESAEFPVLRLRALMRLPGTAHLELCVEPRAAGLSRLVARTVFEPAGALGHAFWWAELPAHKVVFALMTARLAAQINP